MALILAGVLFVLGSCSSVERTEVTSDTPEPFENNLSADQSDDMKNYHLEVWYSGGRLPIIPSYNVPLETIAESNYIPTVEIEDRSRKPYLVNYEDKYFSSFNENLYFYEPGKDGFSRCKNTDGRSVEKLEELKPGDYLMNIRIWTMVYDVVYTQDCYLHIVIPGAENPSPWPVETPTPPPESEPVPSRFLTSDGDWIRLVPALRTFPNPVWTTVPPTQEPTFTPEPTPIQTF